MQSYTTAPGGGISLYSSKQGSVLGKVFLKQGGYICPTDVFSNFTEKRVQDYGQK